MGLSPSALSVVSVTLGSFLSLTELRCPACNNVSYSVSQSEIKVENALKCFGSSRFCLRASGYAPQRRAGCGEGPQRGSKDQMGLREVRGP